MMGTQKREHKQQCHKINIIMIPYNYINLLSIIFIILPAKLLAILFKMVSHMVPGIFIACLIFPFPQVGQEIEVRPGIIST